jgi:SAM-dependent MidA family methyltransferase
MKQGIVILIDYGFPAREYYHPDRNTGTLMCHYRHHVHTDPLINVGLQDITAHVDFTAVASAAKEAGFELSGYTNQANFLMALDILNPTLLKNMNTKEHYEHAQAIKKLLLPSEMGELFKVIALNKKCNVTLQGFSIKNDIERVL